MGESNAHKHVANIHKLSSLKNRKLIYCADQLSETQNKWKIIIEKVAKADKTLLHEVPQLFLFVRFPM